MSTIRRGHQMTQRRSSDCCPNHLFANEPEKVTCSLLIILYQKKIFNDTIQESIKEKNLYFFFYLTEACNLRSNYW